MSIRLVLWFFFILMHSESIYSMFYRLKVNKKYYQQFMDLFKQWDLDKQRFERQQEHLIVGITISFIVNLL